MRKTPRGFWVFGEFGDSYGQRVRVQQSSSAERVACWVFCVKEGSSVVSPHLTVAQAKRLIHGLQRFVDWAEGRGGKGVR